MNYSLILARFVKIIYTHEISFKNFVSCIKKEGDKASGTAATCNHDGGRVFVEKENDDEVAVM